MSIRIVEADLSLAEHQEAVLAMVDAYSRDAMGDGKPLDLPKIREEAETGLRNMEELHAVFAKLVNPDVG